MNGFSTVTRFGGSQDLGPQPQSKMSKRRSIGLIGMLSFLGWAGIIGLIAALIY